MAELVDAYKMETKLSKSNIALLSAFNKGYDIDKQGNIINSNGKPIKQCSKTNDYKSFSFRIDYKIKKIYIHRFQAYKKFGDEIFQEGVEVRHLDGNKENNSFDNIEIGTKSQNMMDMSPLLRFKKSNHATSFVKKYDKEEVRLFYSKNKSYQKTMEKFYISSKGTLHFILNN